MKAIGHDAVHVWLARTDLSGEACSQALELLDEEERRRAARFRFPDDRVRSIVARAALRSLLGRYLGRDPRGLQFRRGAAGKPALADRELEFNVSHSSERIAIAVARGTPVGIDIERERPMPDIADIAARYFAPAEAAAVMSEPSRFFPTWTAKESLLKAIGEGLSIELASFETTPSPTGFTAVHNLIGDPRLDGWFVMTLPAIDDGYHCALAARGGWWKTEVRRMATLEEW